MVLYIAFVVFALLMLYGALDTNPYPMIIAVIILILMPILAGISGF